MLPDEQSDKRIVLMDAIRNSAGLVLGSQMMRGGLKLLKRSLCLIWFGRLIKVVVAMKACPGAHHWGREIGKLGHVVKLIAPAYVKLFVKRQKNDEVDAEAICEAAQRPTMRFVAVKSEAKQSAAVILRARDMLVGQRTQLINALRGHPAEYDLIAPQGSCHVERLIAQIEDPAPDIPQAAHCRLEAKARSSSGHDGKLSREIDP